ncbi:MAG: rhodanese-like domain-containing protein [Prevotella sp.]|nr:rhodanese-like domain-containing protein [Prevotella sp.]
MRIATWLLSLLGFVTACGQHNYENADVNEFANLLTNRQDVVLLDVRTAEEYAEGYIDGAMNIDVRSDSFAERAESLLPKEKTIAVYCRSGRRSAQAANLLAKRGYRVVNLSGGIIEWNAEKGAK